jgi:acetyltransferase-like isoleucine patch superfamily enzyme
MSLKTPSPSWPEIERAYFARRDELREKYARDLPFQDAMFDRWERARILGFAHGASIYNSSLVFGDVQVGFGTWIGPYTLLDGSGGTLLIGATCSISAGVQIYTHDTVAWALSGALAKPRVGSVKIGDRCHIGSQSIIAPGVEIGRCSVVAANSFVCESVSELNVVGGSPARRLGRIEIGNQAIRIVYESGRETILPLV